MKTQLRYASVADIDSMYDISCRAHLDDIYRSFISDECYDRFRKAFEPNREREQLFCRKIDDAINDLWSRVWVYESGKKVVGYTLARPVDGTWTLKGLFVLPEYQGQGIGRQLFQESYRAAPSGWPVELRVIENNSRAIRMYEQEGFSKSDAADETFFGAKQINMVRSKY